MPLNIYNSLTKQIEEIKPINSNEILMYTCGPTVYNYQHIGNFRTFFTSDALVRTLEFNGYKTKFIMNLTDLGHLTSDADEGEDKLEVAAEREGKSAREVADFYIKTFLRDYDLLNLKRPFKFTRATDYIKEQIDLIQVLESKGFTYETKDGVYFDTTKFPEYGSMGGVPDETSEEGSRIGISEEKKNPKDFALWRFSPSNKKRWQEYDSPWGVGFPGWHIECSAMVLDELGDTIDIHVGVEDHKTIHHPNEIAQSEGATGKKFVDYWVHVTHLQVEGGKMSKSKDNFYTVADVEAKGFSPIDLRFFYMTAHYRSPLNFTWESLQSAHNSLKKLYDLVAGYKETEDADADEKFIDKFNGALQADLNFPKAIAIVWELLKSDVSESAKIMTLLKMDEVLGLKIEDHVGFHIPQKVLDLARMRWEYRKQGIWDKADLIRREMAELGYYVEDTKDSYKVKRKL